MGGVPVDSHEHVHVLPLPDARVVGADISPTSIEVANTCFKLPNLSYHAGLVKEGVLEGNFDLILLMDVYEHIAPQDRSAIHATIKSLLSQESRVIMTIPTPALQKHLSNRSPNCLQPVDEEITSKEIITFAEETAAEHLFYRTLGIWRYGDYAHHVFGRYQGLADVALREYVPNSGRKQRVRRWLGIMKPQGRRDYLGTDFCRTKPRIPKDGFSVSRTERRRRAAAWFQRSGHAAEGAPGGR